MSTSTVMEAPLSLPFCSHFLVPWSMAFVMLPHGLRTHRERAGSAIHVHLASSIATYYATSEQLHFYFLYCFCIVFLVCLVLSWQDPTVPADFPSNLSQVLAYDDILFIERRLFKTRLTKFVNIMFTRAMIALPEMGYIDCALHCLHALKSVQLVVFNCMFHTNAVSPLHVALWLCVCKRFQFVQFRAPSDARSRENMSSNVQV